MSLVREDYRRWSARPHQVRGWCGATEGVSLTIRFDTEKKTPTIGRPSKRAAQNPKAEGTPAQSGWPRTKDQTRTHTPVVPFAFFDEGRSLKFRHPLGLEVLQVFELAQPIGYGTRPKAMMTMTNRFVEISAGPECLEIRRYENTDEGVNPNRIQEYCAGRTDQATV